MFSVGDVIEFHSYEARKKKYHLCISLNGHYVFVNSPKRRSYAGDCVFPCSAFPMLDPTEEGTSVVSCTLVMQISDDELRKLRAWKRGSVSIDTMRTIVSFVIASPVLSDEEKDSFLNAIGDWA